MRIPRVLCYEVDISQGIEGQMVDLLVAMLQKLDAATVAKVRDFTP